MSYEAAFKSEAEDQALYTHLEARAGQVKHHGDPEYPPFLLRQWRAAKDVIEAMTDGAANRAITFPTADGGTYSLPARVLAHEYRLEGFPSTQT